MDKKSIAGQGLKEFIGDSGVVDRLVCNISKEQTSKVTYSMKEVRNHKIDLHVAKPDRHNQSKVEVVITEMRKKLFCIILRKKVPCRLWDYVIKWVTETMQKTDSLAGSLNYRNSL